MKLRSLLCAATIGLSGCGGEPDPATSRAERSATRPDGSGPVTVTPTEYATSLTFLGGEANPPTALVLQFANYAGTDGLRRDYKGWLLNRSGWRSIMSYEFVDEPTRAPWRLFPGDSLKLIVDSEGDSKVVTILSAGANYSLELGESLDVWEDRAGTRHEVRVAQLAQRGQTTGGVVVQQRFAIPRPERPTAFGPYERVVLTSEDGAVIVFFHTREPETYGDPFAWMYADGLTRRWTEIEARTVEVANVSSLRRNIPIRSWFRIAEPDIKCELTVVSREIRELPTENGPKPYNALYRVTGWIEFAGERRNVQGVMERGEP